METCPGVSTFSNPGGDPPNAATAAFEEVHTVRSVTVNVTGQYTYSPPTLVAIALHWRSDPTGEHETFNASG